MINTVNKFKEQQSNSVKVLESLKIYLENGEKIGVDIDDSLIKKLNNAINDVETKKLKVALIGGFSEGKTSIAAAWIEKLDKSNMKISHQESSDEVLVYEVGNDIELIDTPGLFGFKEKFNSDMNAIEKYKDITEKYVSEAHLVLYVMNSINPIKDSHKDDLNWLFRTLNLLPRTVFVLSKFDEIVDVEDDTRYKNDLEIKKSNVITRLKDLINLNDNEVSEISIVGVSANPFDMGIEHWLSNIEDFKRLSHIKTLQDETSSKIEKNGGVAAIANETKKTIIKDILEKQVPISRELNQRILEELGKLSEISTIMNREIQSLEPEIRAKKLALKEFTIDTFTNLIRQAQGTSLETFGEFYAQEIGSEGINLNTKIQIEFERQIGSVVQSLNTIETNFNAEIGTFNKVISNYGKQGVTYLSKSGLINNTTILGTRDMITSAMKTIGLDLSIKFKPYGAINLAKGVNGALVVLGFALELWDSWSQHQKQEEFNKAKKKIIESFEAQRKELIESLDSENFTQNFFPKYIELQEKLKLINLEIETMHTKEQLFNKWVEEGEIINVEVYDR
ncbi:LeoA/HP0731 family dynamin-like GTPase [Aliarcobacter cryaerophilus]|jgi:GTP-binding protein EngB required for normal cell division|uniref:LeoA/HP0731 family dynamin-like GTPase n=1 Tax=Aliarcobacter cryaerophilus TaxID=28198 RepID=UPI0008363985|nr:LeoA/HP0731 family dynamin-like GTPase [Aliarcobacter cryaerophilus]